MGLRQKKIFELCRRYHLADIEDQFQNRHQKSLYYISRTRINSKVCLLHRIMGKERVQIYIHLYVFF